MVTIKVDKALQKSLKKKLILAKKREIGGILMGEQIHPGKFRLMRFTCDAWSGSSGYFRRSVKPHSEELESFFKETNYEYSKYNYLGEWHSHPSFPSYPSQRDRRSMIELVGDGFETEIEFAMLLIAKVGIFRKLELNASIFSKNQESEEVEVILI